MTRAPDPLMESLRLLREASLRPGFEARLAEHLAVVASQGTPSSVRRWKKKGLILLAAIALPTAAFASRGWYLERQSTDGKESSSPHAAGTELSGAALAKPTAKSPQVTTTEPSVAPIDPSGSRSHDLGRQATQPSARALRPAPLRQPAPRQATTSPQPKAPAAVSGPSSAPAKIESLEVAFPRGSGMSEAKVGTRERTATASGLRTAASESASQSAAARERAGLERTRGGDHRSGDTAQQARERVQTRERKGQ